MTRPHPAQTLIRLAISASLGLALALGNVGVSHASDLVNVPDATLAACLVTELESEGIGTELTADNLAKLESLSCTGVSDLTGIGELTALTRLALTSANVANLAPLTGASRLRSLWVTGSRQLTSLDSLPSLPALTELDLSRNQISDLAGLAGRTGLTKLVLDGNRIDNLSPLSGLAGLKKLVLSGNRFTSITPLASLTDVEYLVLSLNSIQDLGPLAGLSRLAELRAEKTDVRDLGPLSGLSALRYLHVGYNHVSDISALGGLTSLVTLGVSNNAIHDLSPVFGLHQLRVLDASDNGLTALGPRGALSQLTSVGLIGNQLHSVDALAGARLTLVNISDNQLTNVAALSEVAPDATVYLWDNKIRDFSELPDTVSVLAYNQDLGELPSVDINTPTDLGIRWTDGSPICPEIDSTTATCSAGRVTYASPGLHHGSVRLTKPDQMFGLSLTFTQRAKPDVTFTKVPKIAKLSDRNTEVGMSLRSDLTGTWSPTPTEIDRQWYVNGKPGAGADFQGFYYDVKPSDLGKRVKVCVTAHRNGYTDSRICSAQTKPVRLGDLNVWTAPKITGTAVVGHTLTLKPGTWTPGTTLHYRWLRNGHPIKGATGRTYRLTGKDARAKIEVKVTGTQYGYHSYFVYTKPVRPKR
ncbi:Leucine-rich repeat (LRR) protein [Propionicimonas paludicola]|uniref:Leucine-rich repeat (LRR) protein n=1 Tax=Propionicimonas paludicola TaxID=185243 RepID=A0A2A9CUA7_9ACTN|nr:leucine-rich repeat domain-containing protein [Propionicimonas paludicola]PFG17645.1 Leucine-rich repeat (LRR) protein [Propionicimonas paludicola]